jgi:dTMP kinase
MRLLAETLRAGGERVIETAEPGGTAIGSQIRRILLDSAHHHMSSRAELLLYFAARAQNIKEIVEPALANGTLVFSDRWTDSTFAYQGFGRDLGVDVVLHLDNIACRGRRPDLTFWIDIDPDVSLERARKRNEAEDTGQNRFEEESRRFFHRVQAGYQELVRREPARVRRIDGAGSIEEVSARVLTEFQRVRPAHD